jgi:hypothetical protein
MLGSSLPQRSAGLEMPIPMRSKAGDTEHVEMIGEQPDTLHRRLGLKQYEISNHLGNVLSVITDIKLPVLA